MNDRPVRIGAVSYLNTRALIYGLQRDADPRIELSEAVPSQLARSMSAGTLDVALMPIAALVELPELELVPGLGIGTFGPSRSVLLVAKTSLERVQRVALDPESRTSNLLVQVLFADAWGHRPEFVPGSGDLDRDLETHDAVVRIGDKALFQALPDGTTAHDMGTAWTDMTGLPFLFAAWIAKPGIVDRSLYRALHASRRAGSRALDEIVQAYTWQGHHDPALARHYLSEHIQHRLGNAELTAARRFLTRARQLGLTPRVPELRTCFQRWTTCHETAANPSIGARAS